MRFASPYWLILLTLIPMVALFLMWAVRKRDEAIGRLVSSRLRSSLVSAPSVKRRWISYTLVLAGLALLIVALARPQFGQAPRDLERMGLDIEFMIDASYSMAAVDVSPSRFDLAKGAVSEIMKNLKGDRVGLSMFTNSSLRILPFTVDYGAVDYFLKLLDMKVFLNRGTNIEAAVKGTIPVFEKKAGKSKVMVILSDGEDEPGLSYKLPDEFIQSDLHVYVFGVGTEGGGPVPLRSETEEIVGYMKDSGGRDIQTRLEESTLKRLAGSYNGKYYRYNPEGVKKFVGDLDSLKKEMIGDKENLEYVDYFQLFLLVGLLMLFAGKALLED